MGVIINIGPVHLELLGSIEAIAAAKAELIAGLPAGGTAVAPGGEPLLDPHLRDDVATVTFGPGGDVDARRGDGGRVVIDASGERIELRSTSSRSTCAQPAAPRWPPRARSASSRRGAVTVAFCGLRGERLALPGDVRS